MNAATIQRDQAINLADSDQKRALRIAKRIEDPWFKTQALAAIASCADENDWEALASRAMKTAENDPDAYRAVAASAWALSVFVKRGTRAKVKRELSRLLSGVEFIPNTGSRCDAILLLLEAVFSVSALRIAVLDLLIRESNSGTSWRCGEAIQSALLTLAAADREHALELTDAIADEKTKRRTQKKLLGGESQPVRVF